MIVEWVIKKVYELFSLSSYAFKIKIKNWQKRLLSFVCVSKIKILTEASKALIGVLYVPTLLGFLWVFSPFLFCLGTYLNKLRKYSYANLFIFKLIYVCCDCCERWKSWMERSNVWTILSRVQEWVLEEEWKTPTCHHVFLSLSTV